MALSPDFEADSSASAEDEAYWGRVDSIFSDLSDLSGEIVRNMFFFKDADDPVVKYVLDVSASPRCAARLDVF